MLTFILIFVFVFLCVNIVQMFVKIKLYEKIIYVLVVSNKLTDDDVDVLVRRSAFLVNGDIQKWIDEKRSK